MFKLRYFNQISLSHAPTNTEFQLAHTTNSLTHTENAPTNTELEIAPPTNALTHTENDSVPTDLNLSFIKRMANDNLLLWPRDYVFKFASELNSDDHKKILRNISHKVEISLIRSLSKIGFNQMREKGLVFPSMWHYEEVVKSITSTYPHLRVGLNKGVEV